MENVIRECDKVVLAVAGGITADPLTYRILLENFHTIWVKASPEEHMLRVMNQGDKRPIKGFPRAMVALRNILESREPAYGESGFTLDTKGKEKQQSAQELFVKTWT